jgi:hypothetical protein
MKAKKTKDTLKKIAVAFAVLSIFIITSGFTSCSTIADAGIIGFPNTSLTTCYTCGGVGHHQQVGGLKILGIQLIAPHNCPNSNVDLSGRI